MKITKHILPAGCTNGVCPGILLTDRNTVLLQGTIVKATDKAPIGIPSHEDVIEIPKEVFDGLIRDYVR